MERILNNPRQVVVGSASLFMGVTMYLFFRPAWQVRLLPDFLFSQWLPAGVLGHVGGSLPSFLHVFGLSVLSAGIIAIHRRAYILICSLWASINVLFEILQAELFIAPHELNLTGEHTSHTVLHWLQQYSFNAVFDYYDLLAILLGALSAYWVLTQTQQREVQHGDAWT